MNTINSIRNESGKLVDTQEEVGGVFVDYFWVYSLQEEGGIWRNVWVL